MSWLITLEDMLNDEKISEMFFEHYCVFNNFPTAKYMRVKLADSLIKKYRNNFNKRNDIPIIGGGFIKVLAKKIRYAPCKTIYLRNLLIIAAQTKQEHCLTFYEPNAIAYFLHLTPAEYCAGLYLLEEKQEIYLNEKAKEEIERMRKK